APLPTPRFYPLLAGHCQAGGAGKSARYGIRLDLPMRQEGISPRFIFRYKVALLIERKSAASEQVTRPSSASRSISLSRSTSVSKRKRFSLTPPYLNSTRRGQFPCRACGPTPPLPSRHQGS